MAKAVGSIMCSSEHLWRSLKFEEVYLKAYDTPKQAEHNIGHYFEFYNARRRHQALDYRTPDEVYVDRPFTLERRAPRLHFYAMNQAQASLAIWRNLELRALVPTDTVSATGGVYYEPDRK